MALQLASLAVPYSRPQGADFSWIGGLADNFVGGMDAGRDMRDRREAKDLNRQAVDMLLGGQPQQQPQSPLGGLMPQGYADAPQDRQDPFSNPQMTQGVTTPGAGVSAYSQNVRAAESGGNDQARNPNSTATGRYQFLQGTWDDLMNRYPQLGLTPDGRMDPAQQERAFQVFTRDNARALAQNGIQPDSGSLYAAHFLGPQGAVTALTAPDQTPMSAVVGQGVVQANPQLGQMTVGDFKAWASQKGGGGRSVPSGGGAPAMPASQPAASAGGADAETRQLYAALLNNPRTERLGMALLQRQIAPQEAGFKVIGDALVRTMPDGSVQEVYRAPQAQGFRPLSPQESQQLGLPNDARFQVGPDGKISQIGGGGTTVNVGQSEHGTIPQGYQLTRDEQGGLRMAPIPGGPEDTSANEQVRLDAAMTASNVVTNAAQRAREAAGNQNFGPAGTSIVGMAPWTDSAEIMRNVDVLKAQAAGSNLQAMRDASPTGGALGNVTEGELRLLQNMSGALDPNSPNFLRDLADYERTLLRTIHGREAGDAIFDQIHGGEGQPAQQQGGAPEGVDPQAWEFMTPEERALWQ